MTGDNNHMDARSWRRAGPVAAAPRSIPAKASQDLSSSATTRKERDQENWRSQAHPVADPSRSSPHNGSLNNDRFHPTSPSQGYAAFANYHQHNHPPQQNQEQTQQLLHQQQFYSLNNSATLLSTSLKREKQKRYTAENWGLAHQPQQSSLPLGPTLHSDRDSSTCSFASAIKPSSMGNGIIGRSSDFGKSPTSSVADSYGSNSNNASANRGQWPIVSSLDNSSHLAPATQLRPLHIEPTESSRFFPTHSTPFKPLLSEKERNDNWMLTPTSSLPSIPGTPNRQRESSTDRMLGPDTFGSARHGLGSDGASARPVPSIRGPLDHFQASLHSAPRTPSPSHVLPRPDAAASPSLLARNPNANVQSSPKRSPLAQRQPNSSGTAASGTHLSPSSSPRLSYRTLSPISRHTPVIPEAEQGDQVVNTISSVLAGAAPSIAGFGRPAAVSRRESFNSITSGVAGHTMSHSRRSSMILSPQSPTSSTRVGVYRPPHLRNRGSVSGLKPSVAHYDRVRTPSLRGLSRSRESSISLSRPGSRPPSTMPYHATETIPEDGQDDDSGQAAFRGRTSHNFIHLPGLIAEQQQRTATATANGAVAKEAEKDGDFTPQTGLLLEQPLDSASLLAKLRAQLVRREAAASDAAASDVDRHSAIPEDAESDFFDLSEMMEYGASDGHPLSRHSSAAAGDERPIGDVFDIGDLLGPGLEHDGHVIRIAETTDGFVEQNADLTGSKLQVIRKLGEGSYAVVYLVKEVDADVVASAAHESEKVFIDDDAASFSRAAGANGYAPTLEDDADLTMVGPSEDLLSSTLKAKGGKEGSFHNSPALEERRRKNLKIDTSLRPGKEFALKCLCKRDLPEDMLEVQRLEATIHQSIPAHPNIVTLYRTYETPDWLFLVLEYCPGQDLYYWLEQAQDSGNPTSDLEGVITNGDGTPSRATTKSAAGTVGDQVLGTSLDATPPSPSLLASTSGNQLLSKRRIRLVARMFRQICDAVQFCHDRGVSHRDIKPENFIVEDRRTLEQMQSAYPDLSASTLVDSSRDGEDMQVIVKMTDFGLATAEDRCDDFDCGSKPYMAFECHNNISTIYDPKQADIWSLGVVLLNLLFHRSPFTEPSLQCPSFAAYCEEPILFLMESFDGLTETVARFLSENVFCSVTDESGHEQKRISAGEFSRWACGLVEHMGLVGTGPRRVSRGASIYSTMPLIHSRTGSMSTLPSLLSSPRNRARSLVRDPDRSTDMDVNPDATFRAAFLAARQGSLSPHPALFTPDVLPSPTFTPLPHKSDRNPFDGQYGGATARGASPALEDIEEKDNAKVEHHQASSSSPNTAREELGKAFEGSDAIFEDKEASRAVDDQSGDPAGEGEAADVRPDQMVEYAKVDVSVDVVGGVADEGDEDGVGAADDPADVDEQSQGGDSEKPQSIATSNNSKRRKRGARKGRTLAKQLKRSQSVDNMDGLDSNDPAVRARARERTIRELALASESLARQMSKMTKPSDGVDEATSRQIVLSKPTAEAAAKYNLQALVQEGESPSQHEPVTGAAALTLPTLGSSKSLGVPDGSNAVNWSSAAQRRERMSEQRKTGAAVLQDSGRSRVMSWRERNQSTATFSSFTSSTNTISSLSSTSSATSSIYSTASAPAALPRKDLSHRSRSRVGAFGLDTISEGPKATPNKKEVDAQYLAGIFGGAERVPEKKKKDSSSVESGAIVAQGQVNNRDSTYWKTAPSSTSSAFGGFDRSATAERPERGRLFNLLSESKDRSSSTTSLSVQTQASAQQDQRSGERSSLRTVSNTSMASDGSNDSKSVPVNGSSSFVSRFRRPGSSSSSKSNGGPQLPGNGPTAPSRTEVSPYSGGLGMRRDASTSTSSLHAEAREQPDSHLIPNTVAKAGASGVDGVDANGATTTTATKKRGVGKFLLGMRDSIKNL